LCIRFVSYFQPLELERTKDDGHVAGFKSVDNDTCKRVVDLLDAGCLRLRMVVVKEFSNRVWSGQ